MPDLTNSAIWLQPRLRPAVLAVVAAFSFTLAGCSNLTPTQQTTLSGAGIGTAGGAVIGAIAGNAGLGALIGAGVGAGGGYLYGKSRQNEQNAYEQGYEQGRASR